MHTCTDVQVRSAQEHRATVNSAAAEAADRAVIEQEVDVEELAQEAPKP